ncbi:MAG TPA: DUF1800 domain-containing protein [Isosphaeraceae bacterium]
MNRLSTATTEAAWSPYDPKADGAWDLPRVVHLHRRAGFAASWGELQRDLKEGPGPSVARLLDGMARGPSEGVPEGFESIATVLADAAVASGDPARLKAWWVYRMLFGPDPLGERLTLLWHDHFATSNVKVDDLAAMRRQNETLRRLARAPFGELLNAAVRDPALLAWLDASANRKGHPNENLARELMELFTLGVGHFTEPDVKEAARALTGWSGTEGAFHEDAAVHDDGDKTVLGRKGRWSGGDLVKILLDQPATAERLAWRLCRLLFGEGAIDRASVSALADGLRATRLDVGWGVATILRSRAFFAESNLRSKVIDPVGFVLGPARALELLEPPPSTLVLADWAARLGLDLFYPPNVGGWRGGRSWLSAGAVVGRANFAAAVVEGQGIGRSTPFDALDLAARHGRGRDRGDAIAFFAELLLGSEPGPAWRSRLEAATGSPSSWGQEPARRAVALILACPEAQLG